MIHMKNKKHNGLVNIVGIGIFFVVLATAIFFFLRRATYATIVLRVSQSDSLEENWSDTPIWYLEKLKSGLEQRDIIGRLTISILKNFYYVNDGNKRVAYLTLRMLTTYDKKSGIYTYEGVPLLVGSYQNLRIKGLLLKGVVYRIEGDGWSPLKKTFIVDGYLNPAYILNQDPYVAEMKTDGVKNYLADNFVSGLKINDSDGQTIVEILESNKVPAISRFVNGDRVAEVNDGERKKVNLKVKLTAEGYGDVFLFRGIDPLRINDNVNLIFKDFSGVMTITNVKEI